MKLQKPKDDRPELQPWNQEPALKVDTQGYTLIDPEIVKQINRIEVKVDTVLSMLGYIKGRIKYFEGM